MGYEDEHVPVLLKEVLFWLHPKAGGRYVDCTLGTGKTALEILRRSDSPTYLLGIDRDPKALEMSRRTLAEYNAVVHLKHGNFSCLKKMAVSEGLTKVDGILFDLGVSSPQLTTLERGFSFSGDGPLDMRMDQTQGQTAAEFLRSISESELERVLREYGEERYARRIARAIVQSRRTQAIQTTGQLASIIQKSVPPSYRYGRLHCATRTFQAIRIVLNQELEVLPTAIQDAIDLLTPGGRICVISFHSLEDRIVKQTFRALAAQPDPVLSILTKKPLTPTPHEKQVNPRSRSAKLRVAERREEVPA
ncbi:MAG: 16S rRNA (cytosine(1402)-N(4))-methyltransferase RsmH [Nitrospirota bacterium]|nr:MAG: 16S rRNA (cytosine(1402)-N(4))-methyltransferase RsmH [Nitrospirota bacterium]